jgi:hypothetical protein
VTVTDSNNEMIAGPGSLRIDLLAAEKPRALFTGRLNRRGTTEAQFRFPAGLTGRYSLRYAVDTPIGSTEFTQQVRLEDKAGILLTTESRCTSRARPSMCARWRSIAPTMRPPPDAN